jgi:multiple sugar transport system substrate-binding protein
MSTVALRGVTWDHPRALDPLLAVSELYARTTPGVSVRWDVRSLERFADEGPVELAGRYDLMVVDHPHVAAAQRAAVVVDLDQRLPATVRDALRQGSVGPSYVSYRCEGGQWALPIDAAAQVSVHRPDLLEHLPATFEEAIELAAEGRTLWALKWPDALCSFLSLLANQGTPWPARPDEHVDAEACCSVLEPMRRLARLVPSECLDLDPVGVLERLARGGEWAYAPLLFGYANYARDGFRSARLAFDDAPPLAGRPLGGSIVGGAGLAVSRLGAHVDEAVAFAAWVSGGECQAGPYAAAGGQPAHVAAWESETVNREVYGFYRRTRRTLERAWLRPQRAGFPTFQQRAGRAIRSHLAGDLDERSLVELLAEAHAAVADGPS